MSPRRPDDSVRVALIEMAAHLLVTGGREALTLRRLAREVGTSTMAVYTHFGSMVQVRRAVRQEGFARLAARLALVDDSNDPIADLVLVGLAYYRTGATDPHLYRAMFMEEHIDEQEREVGIETFDRLVACVRRCVEAGRFRKADPTGVANQLWAVMHGVLTLQMSGMLTPDTAATTADEAMRALILAHGDDDRALDHSIRRARARSHRAAVEPTP